MAGNDNDGEVQMSNTKCQLFRSIGTRIHVIKTGKSQFLMPNFELCYLDFDIDLSFGSWNLSLNPQCFEHYYAI